MIKKIISVALFMPLFAFADCPPVSTIQVDHNRYIANYEGVTWTSTKGVSGTSHYKLLGAIANIVNANDYLGKNPICSYVTYDSNNQPMKPMDLSTYPNDYTIKIFDTANWLSMNNIFFCTKGDSCQFMLIK